MGSERRKVVDQSGVVIGRMPGAGGWVFNDQYVSKIHARISFDGTNFVVEGMGRNPVALNNPRDVLPNQTPHPLRNGDRLFVDQYEILVKIMQGAAAAPVPEVGADPFGPLEPIRSSPAALVGGGGGGIPEVWANDDILGTSETAELDPLAALGGPIVSQPELPPVNWQQASALSEHMDIPRPRTPAPPPPPLSSGGSSGGIPDNWDLGVSAEPPKPAAPAPRVPPLPARTAPTPRAPLPARPATISVAPAVSTPPPPPAQTRPTPSEARPATPLPERRGTGTTGQQPGLSSSGQHAALKPADHGEFLRGVGLADRELSPEVMRELGQVMRSVIQGVMDALHARSEIKSQFKLPLTRIKAQENNPLKLSPNVESALHTLLVQRNPGYLGTVAAFEDAFIDIRNHQMAMLEGVRHAYEAMFAAFDPERLEQTFERDVKRSTLLGLGGKAKFWERYAERYEELRRDPEEAFRQLFGEEFADAYEKQLERLSTVNRNVKK